jgi:putative toxin-antitoxin system antitoxin component (TIGR02293 family)
MGNVSLPEAYEKLKDRRSQAEEIAASDLASLAREHGIESSLIPDPMVYQPKSPGSEKVEAVVRLLEIGALAQRVFGDPDKAKAWLSRPNRSLGGQVPSDLLKDELGTAVVRETLEQIDHGIFS